MENVNVNPHLHLKQKYGTSQFNAMRVEGEGYTVRVFEDLSALFVYRCKRKIIFI
jgi:hypothetical protein